MSFPGKKSMFHLYFKKVFIKLVNLCIDLFFSYLNRFVSVKCDADTYLYSPAVKI